MIKLLSDSDFKSGIRDSGPVFVAYIFICMSFGGLAKVTGFSLIQAIAMSMSVFAMPLQVLILQLFHHGLSITTVAILSLIVNSRFFLMSLSLIPYFKNNSIKKLISALSLISASSFTVSHVKFTSTNLNNPLGYYLGIALPGYIIAAISTYTGFYIMSSNQDSRMVHIFAIALGIHFTALTALRWPKFKLILATLLGFLLMPICNLFMQPDFGILAIAIVVACIITLFSRLESKK